MDRHELWEKLADYDLGRIANALEQLVCLAKKALAPKAATGFRFTNTGENAMPTNFTVKPGDSFQLTASVVPTGGALQAGSIPVWSCDDPSVTLQPVPTDPTGMVINGVTLATDTAASFNVTLTGINSLGATISNTQNMAFIAAAAAPATGFSFVQNS